MQMARTRPARTCQLCRGVYQGGAAQVCRARPLKVGHPLHRHHQPARDHSSMGQQHGRAALQCHRLARHKDERARARTQGARGVE
jgi:hypothetical protein